MVSPHSKGQAGRVSLIMESAGSNDITHFYAALRHFKEPPTDEQIIEYIKEHKNE